MQKSVKENGDDEGKLLQKGLRQSKKKKDVHKVNVSL